MTVTVADPSSPCHRGGTQVLGICDGCCRHSERADLRWYHSADDGKLFGKARGVPAPYWARRQGTKSRTVQRAGGGKKDAATLSRHYEPGFNVLGISGSASGPARQHLQFQPFPKQNTNRRSSQRLQLPANLHRGMRRRERAKVLGIS